MSTFLAVFGFAIACILVGLGIGLGIAAGFEIVMRLSGGGRTVLLTWAKTKVEAPALYEKERQT